ncbi:ribonuclease HIII [Facklamia sp. DSM 111018]|uniref:Ribonuclease HIII n=2 Tax=Facklamia lactis TaxID=2749967 RepID=A0ABS0LPJ9_9LACT|nr:ribonuclease HIII [Facklamia lactis]MBG9980172.1 ribonuclease HIII [Facklamia lactis]MBG9985974.1 ribonuclease HIII [Facklamia lactis]
MTNATLKVNQTTLKKMEAYYQNDLVSPVPYSQFRAKRNGVSITAYQSGKVLFQGHQAESEASIWQQNAIQLAEGQTSQSLSSIPKNITSYSLIGSDEVGNGSYFGPLTVCAVYLDSQRQALVQELGVKDSKKLSDKEIQQIAQNLKHTVPYHLTIVNPAKYNQLIKQYNANAMKAKLHNFTIQQLISKLDDVQMNNLQGVLIDQFTPEKNYFRHLQSDSNVYQGKIFFAKKAESLHLAVACASIIARDAFVTSLSRLGAKYGKILPSGASPKVDLFAAQLIDKYGLGALESTAKLHFANTKKAYKLSKKYH